jgi:hypothetical protein
MKRSKIQLPHNIGKKKTHGRSAVTNGKVLLKGIDGRAHLSRRYRDILRELEADLGPDLSVVQMQLARRFAGNSCAAEALEAQICNGEEVDLVLYNRITVSLSRIANDLGIERKHAKEKAPSLSRYLSSKKRNNGNNPLDVEAEYDE